MILKLFLPRIAGELWLESFFVWVVRVAQVHTLPNKADVGSALSKVVLAAVESFLDSLYLRRVGNSVRMLQTLVVLKTRFGGHPPPAVLDCVLLESACAPRVVKAGRDGRLIHNLDVFVTLAALSRLALD